MFTLSSFQYHPQDGSIVLYKCLRHYVSPYNVSVSLVLIYTAKQLLACEYNLCLFKTQRIPFAIEVFLLSGPLTFFHWKVTAVTMALLIKIGV